MILADTSLLALLPDLIRDPDPALVNPASIDLRIGRGLLYEDGDRDMGWNLVEDGAYPLTPHEFVLVETLEHITVPNGYVAELRLKSSSARAGFNHSLAFWVDPGWSGILTMEVANLRRARSLPLIYGARFAQLIVHTLDAPAAAPYAGRYQGATTVQAAKNLGDA